MSAVVGSSCVGCCCCIASCPQKAISLEGSVAKIDPSKCNECKTCINICPMQAISLA